jgi:hypothetical protein
MRKVYTASFLMSDKAGNSPKQASGEAREYEKSGLYPQDGSKPFRIWALLGFLMLVIGALAGAAVLLNFLLLPAT